jgi:site-specific DNA recombinase
LREKEPTLRPRRGRALLRREGIRLSLKLPLLPSEAGDTTPHHLSVVKFVSTRIRRRGIEMKTVLEGDSTPSRIELPLLKAVARARRWLQDLLAGRVQSVDDLAKRERLDRRSVRRLIRLGFLSPRIVEAITEGRQPPDLTVIALIRRLDLPLLWSAQEQALGIR